MADNTGWLILVDNTGIERIMKPEKQLFDAVVIVKFVFQWSRRPRAAVIPRIIHRIGNVDDGIAAVEDPVSSLAIDRFDSYRLSRH